MTRLMFVIMMLVVTAYNISVVRAEPTSIDNVLLKPQKFAPKGFDKCMDNPLIKDACRPVDQVNQYTIIHQPGDETCPAGYFYLLDDKEKVAETLGTEECDPSVVLNFVKNPTNNEVFIVMSLHGEPVTKFNVQ